MEIKSNVHKEENIDNYQEIGELVVSLFKEDIRFLNSDVIKNLDIKLSDSLKQMSLKKEDIQLIMLNIDESLNRSKKIRLLLIDNILGDS